MTRAERLALIERSERRKAELTGEIAERRRTRRHDEPGDDASPGEVRGYVQRVLADTAIVPPMPAAAREPALVRKSYTTPPPPAAADTGPSLVETLADEVGIVTGGLQAQLDELAATVAALKVDLEIVRTANIAKFAEFRSKRNVA